MGNSKNVITLNGKMYDVTTGKPVSAGSVSSKSRSLFSIKKSRDTQSNTINDVVVLKKPIKKPKPNLPKAPTRHSKTKVQHIKHHKPQHAKTLMRGMVEKPDASKKPRIHSTASHLIAHKKKAQKSPPIQPSDRLKRSQIIKRSKKINKFGSHHADVIKKVEPLSIKTEGHSKPPQARRSKQPSRSQATSSIVDIAKPASIEKLISKALSQATSHTEPALIKTKKKGSSVAKKLGMSKRAYNILTTTILILLVCGLVVWHFMPDIQIRLASVKAGFSASLPSYHPAGFALKSVSSSDGQVAIDYASNTDDRKFTVAQSPSNWSSEALLENYVTKQNAQYQTVEDQGKTIYIYGDADATWVNGGVWYKISGNSGLNNDQLLKVADSF